MTISVILCTYNRAHNLGNALESVLASVLPAGLEWEVLVVDNNSKDHTFEVVSKYCRSAPGRVRYIFEQNQGLSNARNTGIRESVGDVIAFMDDDVTVERMWLQNLTASLHDGVWSGAGGRVCAPHGFTPPAWLALGGKMDGGGVLALFDAGDVPGKLISAPYGTNMAFHKTMFEKYGSFRTDLGRCGNSLIGCEDTEFGHRLMAAGEQLRYEPDAIVYHPVAKERLNRRYFRAWWFAYGRAMFRELGVRPPIRGIPRHYVSLVARTWRWIFSSDQQRRFWWETRVWMSFGEIAELYSQSFAKGERKADRGKPH